jgi:methyl-accepting chemotaxis protein
MISLNIGKKLGLGFGVVLFLVIGLAVLVVTELSGMSNEAAHINDDLNNKARVGSINLAVKDNAITSMELLLISDADLTAKMIKQIYDRNTANNALLEVLSQGVAGSEQDEKLLANMKKQRGLYVAGLDRVLGMLKEGKREEASYVAGEEMIPMLAPFLKAVKELEDYQAQKLATSTQQIQQTAVSIRNTTLVVSVVVVLLGLFSAIALIKAISGPLNQMRTAITRVEKNGDFTQRISLTSLDEVGETAQAFDQLMGRLQQIFAEVLGNAEKVSVSAQSLSASSANLANSSSTQSQVTAAMAAAVEQMTRSIGLVSESASEALNISRQSGDLSLEGGEIIGRAATEMSRIANTVGSTAANIQEVGQHSQHISSIVQVIKEIAGQTNLLALNAAIEAARAGEQGRGFSVVADEVRKLAERTTKATEEISAMIGAVQSSADIAVTAMGDSVNEVSSGVAMANQAGATIVKIEEGARHVVDVVNNISSALAEQCQANEHLSSQVERAAQMTANNSDDAAKTAMEAETLKVLAAEMRIAVERFKI